MTAIRIAGPEDHRALAHLRQLWDGREEPGFDRRMAERLAAEGARRFDAAVDREYARLVLSPSERAVAFYAGAGFVAADRSAGGDRLLVRPLRA